MLRLNSTRVYNLEQFNTVISELSEHKLPHVGTG